MSTPPRAYCADLDTPSSELNAIPDELRIILEACLAEDACQQTLDTYLPDVRKIITNLLQGLRAKQSIYRQMVSDQKSRTSAIEESAPISSRPESRSSRNSRRDTANSTRSNPRETVASSDSMTRRSAVSTRRKESVSSNGAEPFVGGFAIAAEPPRSSTPVQPHPRREWSDSGAPRPPSRASSSNTITSDAHGDRATPPPEVPPVPRPPSQVPSHVKRYSLVDRPISSPTPPPTAPTSPPAVVIEEIPNSADTPQDEPPAFLETPPPDGPAMQSSLAALKHSDALERRASKRFSTYNISKMTGGSLRNPSGTPNRRSMAVSSDLTPGDLAMLTRENGEPSPRKRERARLAPQVSRGPSPIAEDEEEAPPVPPLPSSSRGPSPNPIAQRRGERVEEPPPSHAVIEVNTPPEPESASSSTSFPVFLQVGREVKKVIIEPGLSFSSLRVLFVDKFSYSPGQDNFPAIYIRDPSSGVQYELEDMDEVKEKCLLSLNIERKWS